MRATRPTRAKQAEHPLPMRKGGHAGTDGFDDAGDVVAEHERKAPRAFERQQATAVAGRALDVDRVYRGGLQADQHLAAAGSGQRDAMHGQTRRRGGLGAD
jgi:hypothetical protein